MAKNWHIGRDKTSRPCEAPSPDKCPLGGRHFSNEGEANAYAEGLMDAETYGSLSKSSASAKPAPEVYRHPQGKIAVVAADGSLEVFKDGRRSTSSATTEKLREGHGRWTRVPDAEVKSEGLDALADDAPASPAPRKRATQKPLTPRQAAARAKGWPVTTALDPEKTPKLSTDAPVRSHRAAAVLPTRTKVNPHEDGGEDNEYQQFWRRAGDESVVIVMAQEDYRTGRRSYRLINSGHDGSATESLGDSFPLQHDQTGGKIGDGAWTVVGAFEAKRGGAATGEIPNRKIPFYVYK